MVMVMVMHLYTVFSIFYFLYTAFSTFYFLYTVFSFSGVCTCAFVYLSFIFASRDSYLNEKDRLIPFIFKLFTVVSYSNNV